MRDQEVIDAANEHGIAMVFTGMRHFSTLRCNMQILIIGGGGLNTRWPGRRRSQRMWVAIYGPPGNAGTARSRASVTWIWRRGH